MGSLALVAAVVGAAEPAAEEVVVYDLLGRWDHTSWLVQVELVFPTGTVIETDTGGFRATGWQLELVLACEPARRAGLGALATCRVDDAALRATTRDLWQRQADRANVREALRAARAALVEASLVLGVTSGGRARLMDADLAPGRDGVAATHTAERLLEQVVRPFDLPQPPQGLVDGQVWASPASAVLAFPSNVDARQFSEVAHFGNVHEGVYLVQSIGRASTRLVAGRPAQEAPLDVAIGGGDFQDPAPFLPAAEHETGLALTSVAVLNLTHGWMTERVWAVTGRSLHYAGRLRQLAPDERPELGPTDQISPRGDPRPQLPVWTPVAR